MRLVRWGFLPVLSLAAAAGHAADRCQVKMIAELPVTMDGFRPLVSAQINGRDVRLIADSGAFYSMMSAATAADYSLGTAPLHGITVSGIGGQVQPSVTTVRRFTLVGVTIPNVQFIVGGSEVGAAGLLGQNFLGIADTEFDLAHGAIRLMRPSGCGDKAFAYWAKNTPFSVIDWQMDPREGTLPHIRGTIYVNGVRLQAAFDTGAALSSLSLKAAQRVGLKPDGPGVTSAGYAGGVGRRLTPSWIGPVDSFKIGDEEVRHTKLRFGIAGGEMDVDMLLGADFFLSHRLYVAKGQRKIYFTYNGGRVFDLSTHGGSGLAGQAPGGGDEADPADAAGYSRRGEVRAARGDMALAVADLDKAIALAPAEPNYRHQRAVLRARRGNLDGALEDVDQELRLRPDDAEALVMRAGLLLHFNRKADARVAVDAAAAHATPASDFRLALGSYYDALEAYPQAAQQYDEWVAAHPHDSRRGEGLNGRCWNRAVGNFELPKALKYCNQALALLPKRADLLDSRGMVRLRMGDYQGSATDYDAAIAAGETSAWTYYGRGLARLRLGRAAEGEADLAKARQIDPDMPAMAARLGLNR